MSTSSKSPYFIKTLKLASGERLPVLFRFEDGSPLFAPTVYSLSEVRGRSLAANTIEHRLRHIMVLLIFLDLHSINLEDRLLEGRLLELGEIELLSAACSRPVEDILARATNRNCTTPQPSRSESTRSLVRNISPITAGNRLRGIADFLTWLTRGRLLKLNSASAEFQGLNLVSKTVIGALRERATNSPRRTTLTARQGLTEEVVHELRTITDRSSDGNPWKSPFARMRNELIFKWLLMLGLRRGELLGIRVSDINFRAGTVIIARRADDPIETRKNAPQTKTRDRMIPISPELAHLTHQYILLSRRGLAGARKHEFLFVADKTGKPMSLSALNKLFSFLRNHSSALPRDLSPHALRHTWNDIFSAMMDRRKTSIADEEKMRSTLMGWSETSGTAQIYTKRHIRKKANEASLSLQSNMTLDSDPS